MKIFLSAVEGITGTKSDRCLVERYPNGFCQYLVEGRGVRMRYNLMSRYYLRRNEPQAEYIRDHTELVMIDSGAHSFQKGKSVDWDAYTADYAEFISRFDRPNVVGYFEMDVDNVIGYQKVLYLRGMLEEVSEKIIPVWHRNRGVDEFKRMCRDHEERVVAITGFKNEDIVDEQYAVFWRYAHDAGCRIHCLGMTRRKVLDKVPFDYTDSSTWKQQAVYRRSSTGKRWNKAKFGDGVWPYLANNYEEFTRVQQAYHRRWRAVCND